MGQGRKPPGLELGLDLVRREQHDSIAVAQQAAGCEERVAFDETQGD
jgi:hypothetical protein